MWLPFDDTVTEPETEEQLEKRTGKNCHHVFISKTVQMMMEMVMVKMLVMMRMLVIKTMVVVMMRIRMLVIKMMVVLVMMRMLDSSRVVLVQSELVSECLSCLQSDEEP